MYKKEVQTRKSREQKFREYFMTLQLEYIVAELRYKIYLEEKKKEKSFNIMEMKKKKILDMAIRNSLKTIFEDCVVGCTSYFDPQLKKELYAQIYNEVGLPNFIYRDDTHKKQLEFLDKRYYYAHDTKFNTPDGIGLLKWVDTKENIAKVEIGGDINSYSLDEIVRVFVA